MKLTELAEQIKAEWRGDGVVEITSVAPLDSAQPGTLTFIAEAPRLTQAATCTASALIVPKKLAEHATLAGCNLLIAPNPKLAFARAIKIFYEKPYQPRGVSDDLVLGEGSRVGADCSIHPRVTIGNHSTIGKRVTLHPGVVIGD